METLTTQVFAQMYEEMVRLCQQVQLQHIEMMEVQPQETDVMRLEQLNPNGNVQVVALQQQAPVLISEETDLSSLPLRDTAMTETLQIMMAAVVHVQLSQNGSEH